MPRWSKVRFAASRPSDFQPALSDPALARAAVVDGDKMMCGCHRPSSDGDRWGDASTVGGTETRPNDIVWGSDRFVAVGTDTLLHRVMATVAAGSM